MMQRIESISSSLELQLVWLLELLELLELLALPKMEPNIFSHASKADELFDDLFEELAALPPPHAQHISE
jgi:hypothetical protein